MASDRTFVTELATGLGMSGQDNLAGLLGGDKPAAFSSLSGAQWTQLRRLWEGGDFDTEFHLGFANGQAFLTAPAALAGRRPRLIEWTGGRRPPGDEVVPADLRIDHVYLVSCKYLSQILHNPSPARLVEGLLSTAAVADKQDWYVRTAPDEHQALYEACSPALDTAGLPMFALSLTSEQRRYLAAMLKDGWPSGAGEAYGRMCEVVAEESAKRWSQSITPANAEAVLWRLLRIGSVPYFVLGASRSGSMRLRIDTPWDWRQRYILRAFEVEPQPGGQPRVGWAASYEVRSSGEERVVCGHVEIRWSHGRFAQPPEAKVYLDSPHETVPGYNAL